MFLVVSVVRCRFRYFTVSGLARRNLVGSKPVNLQTWGQIGLRFLLHFSIKIFANFVRVDGGGIVRSYLPLTTPLSMVATAGEEGGGTGASFLMFL